MNAITSIVSGIFLKLGADKFGITKIIGELAKGQAPIETVTGIQFVTKVLSNPATRAAVLELADDQNIDLESLANQYLPMIMNLTGSKSDHPEWWGKICEVGDQLVENQECAKTALTAVVVCPKCKFVHGV